MPPRQRHRTVKRASKLGELAHDVRRRRQVRPVNCDPTFERRPNGSARAARARTLAVLPRQFSDRRLRLREAGHIHVPARAFGQRIRRIRAMHSTHSGNAFDAFGQRIRRIRAMHSTHSGNAFDAFGQCIRRIRAMHSTHSGNAFDAFGKCIRRIRESIRARPPRTPCSGADAHGGGRRTRTGRAWPQTCPRWRSCWRGTGRRARRPAGGHCTGPPAAARVSISGEALCEARGYKGPTLNPSAFQCATRRRGRSLHPRRAAHSTDVGRGGEGGRPHRLMLCWISDTFTSPRTSSPHARYVCSAGFVLITWFALHAARAGRRA